MVGVVALVEVVVPPSSTGCSSCVGERVGRRGTELAYAFPDIGPKSQRTSDRMCRRLVFLFQGTASRLTKRSMSTRSL